MLSAPTLKGLISYLSSLDGIAAVYDENFNLADSTDKEFFKKLNLDEIKADPPTRLESYYKIEVDGERYVLSVTPIFKSKRVITAYSLVARNDYQIFKQAAVGMMPEYFSLILDDIKKNLSECTDLNDLAVKEVSAKRSASLLSAQKQMIRNLCSKVDDTTYSIFAHSQVNSRVNCNVTALISALCSDTSECLKGVKRKVSLELEEKNLYAKIDYNLFATAFANIIKYHLNNSPLKSAISITSIISEEGNFVLTVKTKASGKKTINENITESKYFRDLAHKLICYDCKGECEFSVSGGYVCTVVTVPVSKKNRGSLLTGKNSAYLDEDYKPMKAILEDNIKWESDELKEIKALKKSEND